ncbi:hypothetical protein [Spirosoma agri]|uniref:Uncharacterized protein n=1 Tax=Spirosoma agri TaxID=1987381 RepID=A0A6M0IJ70_9BACT|nr:hypothetical protein [Spirosoma agri]NEU68308.1 hypothetical protein [Spirosoma agri]
MESLLFDFVQDIIALNSVEGFIKQYRKNLDLVGDKALAYELTEQSHEKWYKGRRMYSDRSTFHVVLSRYYAATKARQETVAC